MYNYPKQQKMPNAIKYLPRNGTESNNTSSYILFDHSNAFGLSGGNFLSRTSLAEPILSGEGGGEFSTIIPLLGSPCFLTGQNGHMHNLAMGPTI